MLPARSFDAILCEPALRRAAKVPWRPLCSEYLRVVKTGAPWLRLAEVGQRTPAVVPVKGRLIQERHGEFLLKNYEVDDRIFTTESELAREGYSDLVMLEQVEGDFNFRINRITVQRNPIRLLVPFSGIGTGMIGALRCGWNEVVGLEQEPDYAEYATLTLDNYLAGRI